MYLNPARSLAFGILALVTCLIMSCTQPKCVLHDNQRAYYTIVLDPNIPDNDAKVIQQAALEWTIATSGFLQFKFVTQSKLRIEFGEIYIVVGSSSLSHDQTHLGETYSLQMHNDHNESAKVWITSYAHDDMLRIIAIHELGHALGLQHFTTQKTIMYPTYGGTAQHITLIDVNRLKASFQQR